jgi:small conductance mechanosensitive channel
MLIYAPFIVYKEILMEIDIEALSAMAVQYGSQLAYGVAIFIVGKYVAKLVRKMARKAMARAKMDDTLMKFLSNILYAGLMAFVAIAALNKVGIQTASLIAIVGAAGLAIGLALQGSLSNFAAGVMIIIFRHFKVGDTIEAAGVAGTVENLDIFNTTLVTPDNQKVIIPNANITSGAVTNYSEKPTRRINLTIGIGYEDDIAKAKAVILEEMAADARLLKDPAPQVMVGNLGESSVDLIVRAFSSTADYWDAQFSLIERIKLRLDKESISIPYPQRTLHVENAPAALKQVA